MLSLVNMTCFDRKAYHNHLFLLPRARTALALFPPRTTGLHRPIRPPTAETVVAAPCHCSSGSGGRRKSWANRASAGGGGGSAGIDMNGGGGGGHRIETEDGGVSTLTVTVGGREV